MKKGLSCAVLFLLLLAGCSVSRVDIHGKVVSYSQLQIDKDVLAYLVENSKGDSVSQGETRIEKNGAFTIAAASPGTYPYYIQILGLGGYPPASVAGHGLIEIKDKRVTKVEVGTIYVFNDINVAGNFNEPIAIEDLRVQWTSDIPDVDSYKLELFGRDPQSPGISPVIEVTGIKKSEFSFHSIADLLGRTGVFRRDNLDVSIKRNPVEGSYLLTVDAVRRINGAPVTITNSSGVFVTIIGMKGH